jgi:hypothetical protein
LREARPTPSLRHNVTAPLLFPVSTPVPIPHQLTRHEDEVFVSQTIYLSGHAYIRCRFDRCTFVVTNMPFILAHNQLAGCNWHIEYDILWNDPNTRSNLRRLIDAIDGAMDEIGIPPRE